MEHWYNDNHPRCYFRAVTIVRLICALLTIAFVITLCSLIINKKVSTAEHGQNSTLETHHNNLSSAASVHDAARPNLLNEPTILDVHQQNILDEQDMDPDQPVSTINPETDLRWPLCPDILKQIKADLPNVNHTVSEMKETIKNVCLKLPITIINDCVKNVNMYGEALLFLLDWDIDSKYVCSTLEACFKPLNDASENQLIKIGMTETCSQCELIMEILAKNLVIYSQKELTEDYIKKALGDVCVLSKAGKKCAEFIESHADEIVDYFMTGQVTYKGCSDLEMCPDDLEENVYFSSICFQLGLF